MTTKDLEHDDVPTTEIVHWYPPGRPAAVKAHKAHAVGAAALGATAMGALAVGALAIGALAIGALTVKRARFGRVEIDELVVRRLKVLEP